MVLAAGGQLPPLSGGSPAQQTADEDYRMYQRDVHNAQGVCAAGTTHAVPWLPRCTGSANY